MSHTKKRKRAAGGNIFTLRDLNGSAYNEDHYNYNDNDNGQSNHLPPSFNSSSTKSKMKIHSIPTLPNANTANQILSRLQAEFTPLISKYKFNISLLSEMCCCGDGCDLHSTTTHHRRKRKRRVMPNNVLGYNQSYSTSRSEIHIRLRKPNSHRVFLKYESIAGTMCHEMAHCVYKNHSADFYRLMEQIEGDYALSLLNGRRGFGSAGGMMNSGALAGGGDGGKNNGCVLGGNERNQIRSAAEQRRHLSLPTASSSPLSSHLSSSSREEKREEMARAALQRQQLNDAQYCLPCDEVIELLGMMNDDEMEKGELDDEAPSSSINGTKKKKDEASAIVIIDNDDDDATGSLRQQQQQQHKPQSSRRKRQKKNHDSVFSAAQEFSTSSSSSFAVASSSRSTKNSNGLEIIDISDNSDPATFIRTNKKDQSSLLSVANTHECINIDDDESFDRNDNDYESDESNTTVDLTNFPYEDDDDDDNNQSTSVAGNFSSVDTSTNVESSSATTTSKARTDIVATADSIKNNDDNEQPRRGNNDDGKWTCHVCTCLNNSMILSCIACNATRRICNHDILDNTGSNDIHTTTQDGGGEKKDDSSSFWSCPSCTLHHFSFPLPNVCEACGTPRFLQAVVRPSLSSPIAAGEKQEQQSGWQAMSQSPSQQQQQQQEVSSNEIAHSTRDQLNGFNIYKSSRSSTSTMRHLT